MPRALVKGDLVSWRTEQWGLCHGKVVSVPKNQGYAMVRVQLEGGELNRKPIKVGLRKLYRTPVWGGQ